MMKLLAVLSLSAAIFFAPEPDKEGVLGRWMEPAGSTIQIEPCNEGICAKLVGISASAPTRFDTLNPDPALRTRALCGLRIGSHFVLTDRDHAGGGTLYDPKSGKTYSGSMTSDGDKLRLRGYIGVKLFGRSQTWTRVITGAPVCQG